MSHAPRRTHPGGDLGQGERSARAAAVLSPAWTNLLFAGRFDSFRGDLYPRRHRGRAMSDTEGHVTWEGHRTWYRRRGGPAADGRAPLVLLHGGPGGTHDSLEPLLALADTGRPVVLYDQLGNGRSDHLRDAPAEFWTVELFKRELTSL